jgi:Na+:H+ antiporter, NhaA family
MTAPSRLFGHGSWLEASRIADVLRHETVGGKMLLAATVVALAWANSPWSETYLAVRDATFGPVELKLNLSTAEWAADGLLAVFFFVAGLELKREFVAGDLRDPRQAALPVAAAVGGMIVPAGLFLAVTSASGGDALRGWAIPVATDIAFALAVLAVVGRDLPAALRTFLLTLAVVDDLLAIIIIAVFFTSDLQVWLLFAAAVPLAAFGLLVQRRVRAWWLLVPLAMTTWALVHASGVHATVAGVLLAFTVPVSARAYGRADSPRDGLAEHFEHRWRPVSAGIAVPVFALFAAGVSIGGLAGLRSAYADPVAVGVIAGLIIGKAAGVFAGAFLIAKLTRAELDDELTWLDVLGLGLLAGVGFTVSLLIGELAYGITSERNDHVKVAVLTGSLLSAAAATIVLRIRAAAYRRLSEAERRDSDHDGIPDAYRSA